MGIGARTSTLEADEISRNMEPLVGAESSLHRYRVAVLIGLAVAAVPYLWVLWDLWNNSPSLLRTAYSSGLESDFYDLQARAIFQGHLYVPNLDNSRSP